jgi:hypothetical protein
MNNCVLLLLFLLLLACTGIPSVRIWHNIIFVFHCICGLAQTNFFHDLSFEKIWISSFEFWIPMLQLEVQKSLYFLKSIHHPSPFNIDLKIKEYGSS